MMKRREFVTLLGGVAVAWPFAARAQQAPRPVIAALMNISENDPSAPVFIAAFRQQLQELGWTDGRNVRIAIRWAGAAARYREYAAELAALAPAIVLAATTPAVTAMRHATPTVPIVFVQAIDPVGSGLVASLARPGANATGFTVYEYAIAAKWLELLKEVAPGITRVGRPGPHRCGRHRPVRRHPDRLATWHRIERNRSSRGGRVRTDYRGIRARAGWRVNRNGKPICGQSCELDRRSGPTSQAAGGCSIPLLCDLAA